MKFGYPSTDPCTVCGGHNDNQEEPRFYYTVCKEHQSVPPARLDQVRAAYRSPAASQWPTGQQEKPQCAATQE